MEGDGGGQMGGEQNDSETQGDMTGGRVEEGDTIEAGGEDIHGICEDGNVEGRDEDGKGCCVGYTDCRDHRLSWLYLPDTIAQATTRNEFQRLKETIQNLQIKVNNLKESAQGDNSSVTVDSCHVYLRPGIPLDSVNKESISSILGCLVLGITCIKSRPYLALKVRIPKSGLHSALSSGNSGRHHV